MSTRVRLPDGRTVEVNTDDQQAAIAAARRYAAANPPAPRIAARPAQKPAKKSGWLDTVTGFAGDVLDNAVPNMGDEWAGLWGGVGRKLAGGNFRDGYNAESQAFRADQEQYDKDHPNLAWGSTIAGAVTGAALPAGRVARTATTGQRVRQGAAVGGAYGAVAGAGEGDSLAERGENALVGAAFGAGTGAALPAALTGSINAGRWARRNLPGADAAVRGLAAIPRAVTGAPARTAAQDQADRMLGEQMRVGNIADGFGNQGPAASPAAIGAEVEQRVSRGVPAMIGDVTENMRGLTEYASRGMGPGQAIVRRALDQRKALEPQRVRQHVQDTFPTTADPVQFVSDAQRAASQRAAPLYDQAYRQPVVRTEAMAGIEQTPAFQDAIPQAIRNIRNQIDPATGQPLSPRALGFDEDTGQVTQMLSTQGYDQIVRAMRDAGRTAAEINPLTGAVRNNTNSVHINQRAQQLRGELTGQNDPYRQAVEGYGDEMSQIDAFDQGQAVGKLTGPEIGAQVRAMPEAARPSWATGAGTAMADEASQYGARYPTGATSNRVRQMLGDEPKQTAIGEALGRPEAVQDLLQRLEYEQQGHINWQGVNGNSRTAQRQQLDNDLDASAGVPLTKEGVVNRLVNFVASRAVPEFQQHVKQRIAEVVTASGANDVQAALRAIEAQASRDSSFRNVLQRSGIAATAAYGSNVKPVNETEGPQGQP